MNNKKTILFLFVGTILAIIAVLLMILQEKPIEKSRGDYYPIISTMNTHSRNSGFCYNVVTHFNNTDITKSSTLLTRAKCDSTLSSKELVWDFIYVPKTDLSVEQCFEIVVLKQEVFPGHDDLKVEVTGMTEISCADLPNG